MTTAEITTPVEDTASTAIEATSSLSISKSLVNADDSVVDTAGEMIEYQIQVVNTGTTSLTNVVLDDTMSTGDTLVSVLDRGDDTNPGVLDVGETWVYLVSYSVTQADITSGVDLVNTASITTAEITSPLMDTASSTVENIDVELIEEVLADDLLRTITVLSQNASRISRDAADRLRFTSGRACGNEINQLLRQNPVRFADDSYLVDSRNDALLDEIVRILNECESARFAIDGHTDADGSDEYNITLSLNRVRAVKEALVARGIPAEKLETRGFGESRPVATNETEEGQALNRRVEFTFIDETPIDELLCGARDGQGRGLDASANDRGSFLNGSFNAQRYNCQSRTYVETWSELNVTHSEEDGTMGLLSFGTLRERQANSSLFGQFIEGYVSRYDVASADVEGEVTGVGVHAGLFGAHGMADAIILSYYGSVAAGQHDFKLAAGADVDGNYQYAGVFAGGAIGGKYTTETAEIRPRVGIDLAYGQAIGSQISIPDVDLDIDLASYTRAFAEVGMTRTMNAGSLIFIPRAFCVTNSDERQENSCGAGASLGFETPVEANANAQWDIGFDYEVVDERQTASMSVAHSREVFDGAGVGRSSFNATASGAMEIAQTLEFKW